MAQAPFHARPDTVQPGDLRGPFDGQVVDAASGKPLEGATVVASWALRAGRGLSGPSRTEVSAVDTDADGRYRVARFEGAVGVREALERVTLVIYKKGYLGWRSDRRYSDLSPRTDFAQAQNVARLERLPADVSHARHLAWLAASGPLLPKVEWELPLAAEEAAPTAAAETAAPSPSAPPGAVVTSEAAVATHLDGRVLLSAAELKAVSGFAGNFTVEPLPDLPSTPSYDSVHFRAAGQPEKFDAAIRVWKLTGDGAETRFATLLRELPAANETKDVGDRSLRSSEGPLLAVAALDRAQGVVVLFTCGRGLCSDHAQAAALLRRMWARVGRLSQVRGNARAEEPAAVPAPPSTTTGPAATPKEPVAEPAPEPPAAGKGKVKGKGKRGFLRHTGKGKGVKGKGGKGKGVKGKAKLGKVGKKAPARGSKG